MAVDVEYQSTYYRKVWKCDCGHYFFNKNDPERWDRHTFDLDSDEYQCCPYCGKDIDNWTAVAVKFLYRKIRKGWWPFKRMVIFYATFASDKCPVNVEMKTNSFMVYEIT